jgi:hypothetical protein
MTIATLLRRASICLAALSLVVLGLSATAAAVPTITFKTTAHPIPGFPGTGNFLGAGAMIQAEGTVSGTEYGGFPPPLTEIRFYARQARGWTRRDSARVRRVCSKRAGPNRARASRSQVQGVPSLAS